LAAAGWLEKHLKLRASVVIPNATSATELIALGEAFLDSAGIL